MTPLAAEPVEIVVTGRGLDAERPATDVTSIDRPRLLAVASGRLEDVLRDVPGLHGFRRSDSRSANATSQSLTLRGLGGNATSRAVLILDGVPQSDPFGGWTSFPAYSTDRLGRIVVTRGGDGGRFGPGALGGTIELDSATPDQLAPVEGSLAYGSRDSIDMRGSAALGGGRTFVTAAGAFARGDGFVPIVARDRGPVDRPAAYAQASGALRGVIALGRVEAQANLSAFDDRRERGLPNTANRGRGIDASLRFVARDRWSLLGYGQWRRFSSQSAAVNSTRTTATLTNDQFRVPSSGWGLRGEVIPLSGPLDLRLGADLRAVEGETRETFQYVSGVPTRRRDAGGRSLTVGGFAQATLETGALTASLSARLDHWTIRDGRLFEAMLTGTTLTDTRFVDRSGWQPTGRVGLALDAAPGFTFRSAAYRAWRLPTLNELYRPFRAGADATAANAALKPETLSGAEVGADWRLGRRAKLSATIFAADLNDAIANVTIAPGPGVFPGVGFVSAAGSFRRRENLGRITTRGIELGLDARFGAFSTALGYAFHDSRVRDRGLGKALDGLRPAQTPRHLGSATIAWEIPRGGRLALTGRATSRQFDDDSNQRVLGSALTFDASGEVPLSTRLTIRARAENLLDARVEAGVSGDGIVERATPRALWIELRLKAGR